MTIKKYLIAAVAATLATTAFAQIGQAKTFEIYNTTNYVLVTKAQTGDGQTPVSVPIVINPHSKVTLPVYHLNAAEYIRVSSFLSGPTPNAGVFFSLDNDGIHGYTATHFSDRWRNGDKTIKLSICDSNYSKDCQFKV